MIDIDNFKKLNDTYGHNVGDEAIRRIGKVLSEGTRGIDLAARFGGDEFAILLVETELSRGMEVAERLRLAIENMKIPSAGNVTASFGVAECPSSAQTAVDIAKAADSLLYEAKGNGRDRVVGPGLIKSNSAAAGDVQTDSNRAPVV
jgi:diguanylate cyclase (GGDEF)-like protein